MARTAIEMLVRAFGARLQLLAAAGAENWDMGSIYGAVGCPIVSIMEHIDACVEVCEDITGIEGLSCTDFLDVANPVALTEAIGEGAHGDGSCCGLGRNPGVVLGKLNRMPAA
jgi:hypothetical protein